MEMQHVVSVAVLLVFMVTTATAEWSYIVMSPGELRAGMPYDVTVGIIKGGSSNVQLSLKTTEDDSGTTINSKSVTVAGGSSAKVELLYTPSSNSMVHGNVYLHVSGVGGVQFKNVTRVKVTQQTSIMMIATDKGIYKPSTPVQFRVVVMDPDVKPQQLKVDVAITDPNGNKIEQWKEEMTNAGGFASFSYGLADRPPLGLWTIEAFVSGNPVIMDRVNFTVDEYVLPRFEVNIEEVPGYIHAYRPSPLNFKVSAMYTYGEPVVGTVEVTLKWSGVTKKLSQALSRTGMATFSQSISGTGNTNEEMQIIAVVTETKSGEKQNSTSKTTISYKQYPIEMKIVHKDKFFMPDSTYHYQVVFKDPVGNPYPADRLSDLKLTVQYRYDWQTRDIPEMDLANPLTNNIVEVAKDVSGSPLFLQFSVYLKLRSNGNQVAAITNEYAGVYVSKSKTRIRVERDGGDGKVQSGSGVTFTVSSPTNVETLYYVVYSRGQFSSSGAKAASTSDQITIQTNTDMTPSSVFIVYGFDKSTGEMLIASKRFSVTGILKNQVTMAFSQKRQKPGSQATITINADPNSVIALVAVDKSSLLLAEANDITTDGVETALDIFDLAMKKMVQNEPMIWNECNCDAYTTTRIIQLLGINVMTNAYMHYVPAYSGGGIIFEMAGVFDDEVMRRKGDTDTGTVDNTQTLPVNDKSATRVRKYFPETWIWISDTVGSTGTLQITRTVPDSITSWIATAFGSSPTTGLGIAEKADLQAFQPMFIVLRMPYAAIRGESLELKIQVYNYENQKHTVDVTLERSEEFGVWLANENKEQVMAKSQEFTASMEVMSNNSNIVSVWVKPLQTKTITLRVSASFRGTSIADIMERGLLVKPEGVTEHKVKQILFKLDDKTNMIHEVTNIMVPSDFVPDSLFIKASLIGNIMGPALDGLEGLVRMPYGCGEQNMISLVPNIYVRDYLKATGELVVEIREKTDKYMKYGVQRELGYRHDDGSFSAFGKSDSSGSTWLTAFVMKSFAQAKKYIFVDPMIIQKATAFLTKHFSKTSYEFSEPGRVIHSEMQGGTTSSAASLTAYIVTSLLEGIGALDAATQMKLKTSTIDPAIGYLKQNYDRKGSEMKPYMLALTAYALALNGDSKADQVLQTLDSKATVGNGTKCWGEHCNEANDPRPMPAAKMAMDYIMPKPKPNTVEIAAYALLAYVKKNDIPKAQPIMNWLVSQMSDVGGFHSTQDTVLGLQALSTFASKSTQNLNVDLDVTHGTTTEKFDTVTNGNKNLLQVKKVPSSVRKIDFRARGSGTVLLTLSWQYNMNKGKPNNQIDLSVTTTPLKDNNRYKLDICSKYLGTEKNQMVLMKIEIATGYVPDTESAKKNSKVKRAEIENGDLYLYYDELDTLTCSNVYADKVDDVGDIQHRSVTTQLYYEPEVQNVVYYQAQTQQVTCNTDVCATEGPTTGCSRASTSLILCLLCFVAFMFM